MSDEPRDERSRLIREVRQRLESLGRAGIDRIPAPAVAVAPRPAPAPAGGAAADPVRRPCPSRRAAATARRRDEGAGGADGLAVRRDGDGRAGRRPVRAPGRPRRAGGRGRRLRALPAPGRQPHPDRLRRGVADRPADVHRRGPRRRRGPHRATLRRPRRRAAHRHDHQGAWAWTAPRSTSPTSSSRAPPATATPSPTRSRTACPTSNGRSPSSAPSSSACSAGSRRRRSWRPPCRWAGSAASGTATRGIPTIVTYHPAYLLRNPAAKKDAWEDLQMLMQAMGLTPPGRKDH